MDKTRKDRIRDGEVQVKRGKNLNEISFDDRGRVRLDEEEIVIPTIESHIRDQSLVRIQAGGKPKKNGNCRGIELSTSS